MPEWTQQQSNAINARNSNILVSAAAGSGKTAVLVERVVKMITDSDNPVDIDRLLIVTFTNAAAAEMKSRINKSLKQALKSQPDNANIRKQLSLLPNAKICTIDSFCINLVRDNFYTLSINQDFKTFDESELQLLEDGVIGDVINDYFEENDREFISLIELFTTPNNDKAIVSVIKKILRFIYAQPFPYIWANEMIELYNPKIPFKESIWYDYIKSEISYLFNFCIELINDMISTLNDYSYDDDTVDFLSKYLDIINEDLMIIEKQKQLFESSWDEFYSSDAPAFSRLPSSKKIKKNLSEKVKACRSIYKDIITGDIPSFMVSGTEEYTDDMNILYPCLKKLIEVVKAVDNRLMEEKRERNAYSFSDLEHFAIDLLFYYDNGEIKRTELADSLSEGFYEILVDEYQDTNEAQDMLFSFLSNGKNLFTVGDIKQSIYRFRLAMPNIFNEKRQAYTPYSKDNYAQNAKIILDRNFRNRRDICSYVNFIFSNLMTERVGEIDYDESEFLVCGAEYNETETVSSQIKILTGVKGEDTAKKEAEYIAKTIIEKVKSKELIKDGENYRPINYGDFAILMRSLKNTVNDYAEVLTKYK
ncbi:MAG: UvrD-helicase domain-containing protein, partial [Eubacterium sp.]